MCARETALAARTVAVYQREKKTERCDKVERETGAAGDLGGYVSGASKNGRAGRVYGMNMGEA